MGETTGGRNLQERPSPLERWGAFSGAAHSLGGPGKTLGEGQRMTRLQAQLAWLWGVTLALGQAGTA